MKAHSWTLAVALGIAAPALAAGTPAAAAPSATTRAPHGCPSRSLITLTSADNARTICARRGGRVEVALTVDWRQAPAPEQWWQPVSLSGTALTALPDTVMPRSGTTLARYHVTTRGTATLSSTRQVCAPPPTGGASCLAMESWSATVVVR